MLGLGRDLARTLDLEPVTVLNRIKGGIAFRAPGVALALLADRVLVIQWTRPPGELSMLREHLTQRLGGEYHLEDMRAIAAPGAVGRAGKRPGHEGDRIIPDPEEPAPPNEREGEDAAPTAHTDDDFGPGF